MRVSAIRDLAGMKPVLMEPSATGPDPVYWVFNDISHKKDWVNLTLLASGRLGSEYPKTFGHYHSSPVPEIYHRIHGEGILILQKKHFEGETWVPERVDEVLIISAKHGDELTITPEYGHSWSNTGDLPLILYDTWNAGHQSTDYAMIEKLHGLAYYLVESENNPKAVPNPNYTNLPEPTWMTVEEFNGRKMSASS